MPRNRIILDEELYVKTLLETYDSSKIDVNMHKLIFMLAKYFRTHEQWVTVDDDLIDLPCIYNDTISDKINISNNNFKKAEEILIILVDEALQKFNLPNYYYFQWKDVIKSACNNTLKYSTKLKSSSTIPLLNDEIENIKSLDSDKEKKLLAVCYILGRYLDKNGRIDEKYTNIDIFEYANIKGSKINTLPIITSLCNKGYLSQNYINDDNNIWVILGQGTPELEISDFKNLGNQILAYIYPDRKQCEVCGKLIRIKSKHNGSSKYCPKCAKYIKNEQNKLYYYKKNEFI